MATFEVGSVNKMSQVNNLIKSLLSIIVFELFELVLDGDYYIKDNILGICFQGIFYTYFKFLVCISYSWASFERLDKFFSGLFVR